MIRIPTRFQRELSTDAGFIFMGTISTAPEGHAPASDYTNPRLWLRVAPELDLVAGSEIIDEMGRHFLTATHESAAGVFRTFKLVPLTVQVSWKRVGSIVDALTQLKKSTDPTELGPIWVSQDPQSRLFFDPQVHIAPNRVSLVTGRSIQLNDLIDGKVVKRVNSVLGVNLAECE
jgi:hypothetical protein